MEYIAAALEARGHRVHASRPAILPNRSSASSVRFRPALVGIACMHALEIDDVLRVVAARVRAAAPDTTIIVGGHSAAAYPSPFSRARHRRHLSRRRRASGAGARRCARSGRPLADVAGWLTETTGPLAPDSVRPTRTSQLDDVPLPARHVVAGWRHQYACLHHRPTYLIETARGCPFRCSFCSVWQLFDRNVRERSIESVCHDFATTGDHIFVADDLFWHHAVAQPRARRSPSRARTSQGLDARAVPRRSGRAAPRAARGVAADRARVRHLLRPRGGDERRSREPRARTRPSITPLTAVAIARE